MKKIFVIAMVISTAFSLVAMAAETQKVSLNVSGAV